MDCEVDGKCGRLCYEAVGVSRDDSRGVEWLDGVLSLG